MSHQIAQIAIAALRWDRHFPEADAVEAMLKEVDRLTQENAELRLVRDAKIELSNHGDEAQRYALQEDNIAKEQRIAELESSIQQLIEDYERRASTAMTMLEDDKTTSSNWHRISGLYQAYKALIPVLERILKGEGEQP